MNEVHLVVGTICSISISHLAQKGNRYGRTVISVWVTHDGDDTECTTNLSESFHELAGLNWSGIGQLGWQAFKETVPTRIWLRKSTRMKCGWALLLERPSFVDEEAVLTFKDWLGLAKWRRGELMKAASAKTK